MLQNSKEHSKMETLSAWNMSLWNISTSNGTNGSLGQSIHGEGLIPGLPDDLVDPTVLMFRAVIHGIDLYGIPVISVVGILGNLLCFLVFMATYLRSLSSSTYLAALAVCDTVFLTTTLFSWMDNVNINIYHRHGVCQVLTYIGFITSFLDVWYVVGFTVERYLAVCFPLKRQGLCTVKRARIVVVSLAILGAVLFNFTLWTSEVGWYYERPFCHPKQKYYNLVLALSNVDTIITLILPTIIIVTCNIRIGYAVAKFYYNHVHLKGARTFVLSEERTSMSEAAVPLTVPSYNRLQMKVTKMLLVVSTVFLICHIPSHGCRVYVFIMSHVVHNYSTSHRMILVQKLFQYLYILNFSLNFFLYNISGKTFRRALVQYFQLTRGRIRHFVRSHSRQRSKSRTTNLDTGMAMRPLEQIECKHVVQEGDVCKVCEKYS